MECHLNRTDVIEVEQNPALNPAQLETVAGGMTNAETPWGQAFIKGFYKGLCGPPNGCGPWGYLGD